jgi:hypothetical protein
VMNIDHRFTGDEYKQSVLITKGGLS